MLSSVQIATPPAVEPIDINTVRRHCRIDHESDNDILSSYLTAARTMCESYLSRVLITQTLLWTVEPENAIWPATRHYLHGALQLPRGPAQSVSSVTVLDTRGNSTAVPAATLPVNPPALLLGYKVDTALMPARLEIGLDTVLSDGRTLRQANIENIQVQFVAGYGAAGSSVPTPILQAVLLTTAFLYEHRGDAGGELPKAAEWLLDPYRMMWVA